MVISPLALILVLVLVLMLAGSGYGYYSKGAYANPLGAVGAVLLVLLLFWLLFGGVGFWAAPPP